MSEKGLEERLKRRQIAGEYSVRKDYTMLPSDIEQIEKLANSLNKHGARINNSEVIRAGLQALRQLKTTDALKLVCKLPKLRTGIKKASK
jgi:Arc/MetJ-type ribon-helix-helix transcriptional regulator